MKRMYAKFTSKCNETGRTLKKGDVIYFHTTERKAYHPDSEKVRNHTEAESIMGYIQAQEDAMFERYSY
jgi:hypothetical protein